MMVELGSPWVVPLIYLAWNRRYLVILSSSLTCLDFRSSALSDSGDIFDGKFCKYYLIDLESIMG